MKGYDHIPGRLRRPHVAEYLACPGGSFAFPCALRGPFDELFPTRFPASRALCGGIFTVISASTVWMKYAIEGIIATYTAPVNGGYREKTETTNCGYFLSILPSALTWFLFGSARRLAADFPRNGHTKRPLRFAALGSMDIQSVFPALPAPGP